MKRDEKKADCGELSVSGSSHFSSAPRRKAPRTVATTLLSLLWLMAGAGALYGQQTSATLVGSISDSNGAVVQKASVKVVNLATGAAREVVTDDSGDYSFAFLPAGNYEVTISAVGYKTKKVDRLTLQVSQTLRQDFTMEVGAVSETVSITAIGVQLQ